MPSERLPKEISTVCDDAGDVHLFVRCNDGTIWNAVLSAGSGAMSPWGLMPPIPQCDLNPTGHKAIEVPGAMEATVIRAGQTQPEAKP